ncbi:arginine--tRNA ligase [Senegalia massiliensis]|uniref:arginine--tRNA ligase n=1 Tax=Senegalia massiliensis TaxID=1720316 RepID=UPI001032249C|nr:arginine--tRNA ligase [Senegalia massiliensis]
MIDFKEKIGEIINQNVEQISKEEVLELLETPPSYDMGDYAMPCFKMAKIFRKSPNLIAEDIVNMIGENKYFENIENKGAYVNFFVNKELFSETVLKEVYEKENKYGATNIGKNRNVIVEFSSPNIAKPFHIGHIRSTVIGHSIYKIYDFLGFNTIAINHLGDYGTQFGKLIVAYKAWGDRKVIESNPIPELLKLYIKFHEEVEKKPELDDKAREWFFKLEEGEDPEAKELWQWIRDVSLKEFNRVYEMLNIKFDSLAGESFYSDKMPRVIDIMNEKGILEDSQGARIVDLEPYGMPPALVQKRDGSTLYITRDVAAALYRKETYDFYKNIYVVGSQQILHFQQWMKMVELMGFDWAKDCVHVPFGMVSLEEGTMSTRKGRVVFLEDVLNKAVDKTKEIIEQKNPNLENKEEVAKQIGIGAIVFQELSNSRIKDYTFSWDKTLAFEGETGPYVQYTHARANSILKKANVDVTDDIDYSLLLNEEAVNVVRLLHDFKQVVIDAMEKYEPAIITRHIVDIAQAFNRFYHDCPILVDDEKVKKARLLLVKSTRDVLKTGLSLIAVEAPEKM